MAEVGSGRASPTRIRAVLFDWDGTQLDSADACWRSYERLFRLLAMARAAAVLAIGVAGSFLNREVLRAARPDVYAADLASAAEALLLRTP